MDILLFQKSYNCSNTNRDFSERLKRTPTERFWKNKTKFVNNVIVDYKIWTK